MSHFMSPDDEHDENKNVEGTWPNFCVIKYFSSRNWKREETQSLLACLGLPPFLGVRRSRSQYTFPQHLSTSGHFTLERNNSNLPAEGTLNLLTPHSSLFPGCQGRSPSERTDPAGLLGRRRELLANGFLGSAPSSRSFRLRDAFGLGCQAWVLSLDILEVP